ncbi:hypothetical protein [Pseudodesulfovibrio nedwellii]|nr:MULTISPECIES: hypothetical protein [Pseudodesulfovibrio]
MFSNLTASRIMEIILGSRSWLTYIDSFKSWSQDWNRNQNS